MSYRAAADDGLCLKTGQVYKGLFASLPAACMDAVYAVSLDVSVEEQLAIRHIPTRAFHNNKVWQMFSIDPSGWIHLDGIFPAGWRDRVVARVTSCMHDEVVIAGELNPMKHPGAMKDSERLKPVPSPKPVATSLADADGGDQLALDYKLQKMLNEATAAAREETARVADSLALKEELKDEQERTYRFFKWLVYVILILAAIGGGTLLLALTHFMRHISKHYYQ